MADEGILLDSVGSVAVVTINRPRAMNALTVSMLRELETVFAEVDADDRFLTAVITGAGDRAFCTGADLAETIPAVAEGGFDVAVPDPSQRFLSMVATPVVAAVNGIAVAGGLEIMLGTDLRVAAESARFGLGEVKWGVLPAGGSHIRLPRQVPWAIAMELLLTGDTIDSGRALGCGLVNRVVPDEKVFDEALALAERVAANAPLSIRAAKEIAVRAMGLEEGFRLEAALARHVFASEDAKEGPRAFTEKRRPVFTGR